MSISVVVDASRPSPVDWRIILVGEDSAEVSMPRDWSTIEQRWASLDGSPAVTSLVRLDGEPNVLVVGVGDGSLDSWRRAGAAASRALTTGTASVEISDAKRAARFAEGFILGGYRVDGFKSSDSKRERTLTIVARSQRVAEAVDATMIVADAVCTARDLANTPSNIKSPSWLARQANQLLKNRNVTIDIRRGAAIADFAGLQAVAAGSQHGPVLVQMDYSPAGARRRIAIVGKGITYDSGGLSIKPADGMALMKTDMSGAAAVIATMSALADLEVAVAVTGLIAIAENMPGAASMRPGDVIRHRDGRTTEILNTDAEGRLVLADTLAYAADDVHPECIVDLATLTGAATMALGRGFGAVFSNDDRLGKQLVAAGNASGDRLWPMPLVDDYRSAIASSVADAANVNTDNHTSAGAITAALFLEPFAHDVPWAHLDIAGAARSERDNAELTKGATGFGVRLLLNWLTSLR